MLMGLFGLWYGVGGAGKAEKNAQINDEFYLKAEFGQAEGVKIGSAVLLNGVAVGKVRSISLNPDNFKVNLTLGFDRMLALPLDSSVKITSSGLFSGKNLQLIAGADWENLEDGDKIEYSQDAVNLEVMLQKIIERADRTG